MKTVLLALFVWLLAPAVWAGDRWHDGSQWCNVDTGTYTVCLHEDPPRTITVCNTPECGKLFVTDGSTADPCLVQMESAMRAMEPFLDGTRHINLPMTEPMKDSYFHDRGVAYVEWYAVKRLCWRQP